MIGRLIWRSRHAAIDAALLQAHTFWTESDNRKLDDVLDLTAKWPSAIAVQLNTDLRGRSIEPHSNTLFLTAAARGLGSHEWGRSCSAADIPVRLFPS